MIGLPVAAVCLLNFAVTAAACYMIGMLNEISRAAHEIVDYLLFQSSVLIDEMDEKRRGG